MKFSLPHIFHLIDVPTGIGFRLLNGSLLPGLPHISLDVRDTSGLGLGRKQDPPHGPHILAQLLIGTLQLIKVGRDV